MTPEAGSPHAGSKHRIRNTVSALAILTSLGVGGVLAFEVAAQDPIEPQQVLSNGAPLSFADLIERVSPAVVSVNVTTSIESPFAEEFDFEGAPPGFEEFFRQFRRDFDDGEPQEGRSLGSGFLVSSDGYIVTNNHVVNGATSVTVTLNGEDEVDAEIVGTDESTDLAVLKIVQDDPLPYVEFATNERVRVGDWVVAVGNPFGLGGTATAGIISASGREIGGQYNDFLQIDAPINRGNSGGPTFNLEGHVIGVNSQIFSPSGGNVGIGFAIPATTASRIVDAIISDGRVVRGWLGVTIDSVTDDIAEGLGMDEARGAIVNNVFVGEPAELAGFEVGDVVLTVNGEDVDSSLDLTRKIGNLVVGDVVRFEVLREDERLDLTATVAERPTNEELAALREAPGGGAGAGAGGASKNTEFGLRLSSLDEDNRARLGLDEDVDGVVIDDAARDSEAVEEGLQTGDVILEVAGESVATPADFDSAVDDAREEGRNAVLLLVQTLEGRRFVALTLEDDDG